MNLLPQLKNAQIYVDTNKVAAIVDRSAEWVRKNATKFTFKRDTDKNKKGKKLKFEISSVIEVAEELNAKKVA